MPPKFDKEEWNLRARTMEDMPRTNNNFEAFHSALRKSITATNPSLWSMIAGLKKEEALAAAKITKFVQSGEQTSETARTRALKALITGYSPENKMRFLRGVAHNLKLF